MTERTCLSLRVAAFIALLVVFSTVVLTVRLCEIHAEKEENAELTVLNLNTATSEELQRLEGLSADTAERILTYRERFVFFTSVEQLLEIRGVTPERLKQWRPYLAV